MATTSRLDPDAIDALIRARRTCLQMHPDEPIDPEIIADLCRLATWAPNHRRTEPWRFAAFTGDGRRRLGDAIAAVMSNHGAPPEKVAKTRTKYLRAPVLLLVASVPGSNDTESAENRDAVAAAVQNILLAATARGVASFWSSVATPSATTLLELCGFDASSHVVAAIYLGHPTGACPPPARSGPKVTWVGEGNLPDQTPVAEAGARPDDRGGSPEPPTQPERITGTGPNELSSARSPANCSTGRSDGSMDCCGHEAAPT